MPHETSETRTDHLVLRVAARIPRPMLESPERMLINAACVLLGVGALLDMVSDPPRIDSLPSVWPATVTLGWATLMIVGGLSALWGQTTTNRVADRAGAFALAGGCAFYGVNLLLIFDGRALSSVIFFGIALAKVVRLIRSAATRIRVEQARRLLTEEGQA